MSPISRRRFLAFASVAPATGVDAQWIGQAGWSIRGTNPIEIYHGERRITAYHAGYAEGLPFFDPVVGPGGAVFTASASDGGGKGKSGATPRATGLWFALDGVNGHDFRGAPGEGRARGRILHKGMNGVLIQGSAIAIRTKSEWMDGGDPARRICSDRREFTLFYRDDGSLVIEASIELIADAGDLEIDPGGEGGWSLRLVPSLAWAGKADEVALRNGEGLADALVPGARAKWVACQGQDAKGRPAGVAVLDHPANPGHPAGWTMGEDGLLAATAFPEAASGAPHAVPNGESRFFRYRTLFHRGATDVGALGEAWEAFAAR